MSGPSLAADLGSLPAEAHQTQTFEFPKRSFGKKVVVNRSYLSVIKVKRILI